MIKNLCFFDLGRLRRAKIAQDKRKNGPRASQDVLRASQERHKSAPRALQERSKTLPDRKSGRQTVTTGGSGASVGGMLAARRRGGGGKLPLGKDIGLVISHAGRGAADLRATPSFHRPLRVRRSADAWNLSPEGWDCQKSSVGFSLPKYT